MPIPRLQAWYGDDELTYTYSKLKLIAHPWLPTLVILKKLVEQQIKGSFNAVLANYYRDQNDAVSWHSDNEDELGEEPVIASLSFGDSRDFKLKHNSTGEKLTIPLKSGSLLIMSGKTQHYWQHCLPRCKREKRARINLTFRLINN